MIWKDSKKDGIEFYYFEYMKIVVDIYSAMYDDIFYYIINPLYNKPKDIDKQQSFDMISYQ